jgi:PAS domain S-box-containing protein
VVNGDLRFVMTNEAWQQVLGWTTADLRRATVCDLTHEDDRAALLVVGLRIDGHQQAEVFENRMRCKDGSFRRISWTSREREGLVYVAGRDVTTEHSLSERLVRARESESVGQIVGGLAHDFNNVLTTIAGLTRLARDRMPAADPMRDDLGIVLDASRRAEGIIRQLLAVARRPSLTPRLIDLSERLRSVQPLLPALLHPGIAVSFDFSPERCPLFMDAGQFDQIVLNLAINARDAMPDGGELAFRTQQTSLDADYARSHEGAQPGEYVSLIVRDTGHGMDHATLARVFEPYFSTKPPQQGSGLGLTTVYRAVKHAGGYIAVESSSGSGTTFTLHFRRAAGTDLPVPQPHR